MGFLYCFCLFVCFFVFDDGSNFCHMTDPPVKVLTGKESCHAWIYVWTY